MPSTVPAPPASVPLPSGTGFSQEEVAHWVAYFNVTAPGVRLIGAWTAFDVAGDPLVVVVNGSVAKFGPVVWCGDSARLAQSSGSINVTAGPGPHTLSWALCLDASRIVVPQSIRLVRR